MTKLADLSAALAEVSFLQVLHIEADPSTGKYQMYLLLRSEPGSGNSVSVRFDDVGEFSTTIGLGGWSQIQYLGVFEERLWFERKYFFKELEYDSFQFSCSNAELVTGIPINFSHLLA